MSTNTQKNGAATPAQKEAAKTSTDSPKTAQLLTKEAATKTTPVIPVVEVTKHMAILESPAIVPPAIVEPVKPAPTVEDVREKNRLLSGLFDREEKLLETKKNIQNFRVANNEMTNRLEIADGTGCNFKTHNPQIIGAIIDMIKKDVDQKLEVTQAEIIALA